MVRDPIIQVTIVASVDTPKGKEKPGRFRLNVSVVATIRKSRLEGLTKRMREMVNDFFEGASFNVEPISTKKTKLKRERVISVDVEYLDRKDRKYEAKTRRELERKFRGV